MRGRRASGSPEPQSQPGLDLLKVTLDQLARETATSRDMQQKAIGWLGATTAALFFGAIVYATNATSPDGRLLTAVLALAVPTAGLVSCVVFLGELFRQGRTALLLRAIEKWAAQEKHLHIGLAMPISPLFIETAFQRAGGRARMGGYGVSLYYLAVLALFGGAVVLGPAAATWLTWNTASVLITHIGVPIALPIGGAFILTWVGTTLLQALRIRRLSQSHLDLPTLSVIGPSHDRK